jgi:hypothetical protein
MSEATKRVAPRLTKREAFVFQLMSKIVCRAESHISEMTME